MRLLISVAMYLLSLALTLVGIAERTVWAPPQFKAISISIPNTAPLLEIPNSVLTLHKGKPILSVQGDGKVYLATGRESDVSAWIAGSSMTNVYFDKSTKKLASSLVEGIAPSANPTGSDLWRTERTATAKVSAMVDTGSNAAVLLASDGLAAAPGKLKIEWQRNYDLTPSNVFLYSGLLLMVATLVYNILVFRNIRNSRRPRRKLPKAPHGPRSRPKRRESSLPRRGRRVAGRNYSWIPASLVMIGLVSGCAPASSAPIPTPTNKSQIAAKPAALQLGQIRRIVTSVASIAKVSDQTLNSGQLLSRFAGPALEMRQAAYSLLKKTQKAPTPDPIYSSPLTLSLPAATDTWPRTLMVVSGTQKNRLPILLVLRQNDPRSQYLVWYSTTLISGVKLPAVPAVNQGSVPVVPSSAYLRELPLNLPNVYGSVIDQGSLSPYYPEFDLPGDTFYSQISKIQKDQLNALTKANLTYQHTLSDPNPLGLSAASGGALVAVYMKDVTTIKPTKKNSGITVNSLEQVALGAKGSVKGIVSTYGDMLLFYVPAVGQSQKIKLIGWQAGLLTVKSL